MSYCSNCGAPLRDGSRFCPNCGHQQNTSQGQSNESFWNAAAEPGEVVLSSWENPNPQPAPQPQAQQQAQFQYQPQARPPQGRASNSPTKKGYRENLTESIKASAEERHREEEARSRSNRGCGIAVIILIIAVVLLAIFL